ncbi:MAG: hypothetical protein M1820_001918 [Bogoriella megaspora]|nr:MAG: hypothetical protein M1820_001918 [Bogoriella megaspora]
MAEDPQPQSIQARIAALKLNQVVGQPESPPPSYEQSIAAKKARAPPPPPPAKRPAPDGRRATANNPPLESNAPASANTIGNQPDRPTETRTGGVIPAPKIEDYRPDTLKKTSTPSIPTRPGRRTSEQTPALPPRTNTGSSPALPPRTNTGPSPKLPPRTNSNNVPGLPPRRPSEQLSRRDSSESISSTISSISALSNKTARTSVSQASDGASNRVKAPIYDPATLPPLPPKKQKPEKEAPRSSLKSIGSSPNVALSNGTTETAVSDGTQRDVSPQLPLLPVRPSTTRNEDSAALPPKRSILSFGMNKSAEQPPPFPTNRPQSNGAANAGVPPPVPLSSRPDLAALQASKPKPLTGPIPGVCLHCRDFSAADAHAARFPRETLPTYELSWLAQQLTSPFPNSPTDQARAIYTWLHHNIAYNVEDFFSGNVKSSTPFSTVQTGKAVCEGYAGLFTALATHAGLQSLVVGGHGKGYGHSELQPGQPIPPFSTGHAWNSVYLPDSGVPGGWKLIDCCWGAGVVNGPGEPYKPWFRAAFFAMSNEDFGDRHYPADRAQQHRADGRQVSWEHYMLGDAGANAGPKYCDGYIEEEGIKRTSFEPKGRTIDVSNAREGEMMRFRFGKVCAHWTYEKNGKGPSYVFVLKAPGMGTNFKDIIPFETNGLDWWVDVPTKRLGRPGEQVRVFATTTWDGRDGRGVSLRDFKAKLGRCGMSWAGMVTYDLV